MKLVSKVMIWVFLWIIRKKEQLQNCYQENQLYDIAYTNFFACCKLKNRRRQQKYITRQLSNDTDKIYLHVTNGVNVSKYNNVLNIHKTEK